ncbi:MAG: alanine racemase, partial [Actinomycetota bacterium]|nr:alanine racemase [Actinomycetota bacterium]
MRPTWVTVDLEAVAYNVAAFRDLVAPAEVCAVVKADGYGHGALPVAQAALGAGATWLAVALVEEAAALRGGGLDVPILLLSEPRQEEMAEVVMLGGVRPTVYTEAGIRAFAAVADPEAPVHLKVDTGMHRVGVRPAEALTTARLAQDLGLCLEGVFTHCSVADIPDDPLTDRQVRRFDLALDDLASAGIRPAIVHMANTAATVSRPDTRRNLVRVGIGVYGV